MNPQPVSKSTVTSSDTTPFARRLGVWATWDVGEVGQLLDRRLETEPIRARQSQPKVINVTLPRQVP